EVADLTPGSAGTTFGWLKNIGGKLYFTRLTGAPANPTVDVFGVDANGVSASPIVSYTAPLAETGVAVVGTNLYYHAFTPDNNDTLFVVDLAAASPTPVALAAFPTNVFGFAKITQLTAANGLVYFSADDSVVGQEPWVTNGTVAGTH